MLNAAGIPSTSSIKNDVLHKLVTVTGSDGHQVDFGLGEVDPAIGDEPVLVAYSDTGGQLTGGSGFARRVMPGHLAGLVVLARRGRGLYAPAGLVRFSQDTLGLPCSCVSPSSASTTVISTSSPPG